MLLGSFTIFCNILEVQGIATAILSSDEVWQYILKSADVVAIHWPVCVKAVGYEGLNELLEALYD